MQSADSGTPLGVPESDAVAAATKIAWSTNMQTN
jgi:hypothetical protein